MGLHNVHHRIVAVLLNFPDHCPHHGRIIWVQHWIFVFLATHNNCDDVGFAFCKASCRGVRNIPHLANDLLHVLCRFFGDLSVIAVYNI